ncbi:hypothetical protein BVX98_00320 [bacterium F11]|nr:hypothetical protein BVX98_00320 [bacterium F11]
MTSVCLVGVGLIGGSLGQALRSKRRSGKRLFWVSGCGRSTRRLKNAKRLKAIDEYSLSMKVLIPKADIIVLCVPVQFMAKTMREILPYLKSGAIVTDVGSVKQKIIIEAKRILGRRKDVFFVGAHPIAGSEKSGVIYSRPDLFSKAACILTTDGIQPRAFRTIRKMWEQVGAICTSLTAKKHDEIMALVSHLPHFLSFALLSLVEKEARKNSRILSLVGRSFRDMTRVGRSDPILWKGIFRENRFSVKRSLMRFHRILKTLRIQLLRD